MCRKFKNEFSRKTVKITFVVPSLNLTGGIRVVSIYADLLAKKGHTVTVISPNEKKPTLKEKIKSIIRWKGYQFKSIFNSSFFSDTLCELRILECYRPITDEDVPDADVVIATFWNTAEWVGGYSEKKGKKVYFIQHYEMHPWLPVERVKATFMLPLKKIVVAQWIADTLNREHGKPSTVVENAVDHTLFNSPRRIKNKLVTYGMMYSAREYKGSQWAFECFNKLHSRYPNTKLIVFGLESLVSVVNLPVGAEYFYEPEQDAIRDIYSECDAYLFTSSVEGFGLPILEAMACRTPVIGTRCGAAPELLASGGGWLVNIADSDGLLLAMKNLYKLDAEEWRAVSDDAYKEAALHSWQEKTGKFEKALLSA